MLQLNLKLLFFWKAQFFWKWFFYSDNLGSARLHQWREGRGGLDEIGPRRKKGIRPRSWKTKKERAQRDEKKEKENRKIVKKHHKDDHKVKMPTADGSRASRLDRDNAEKEAKNVGPRGRRRRNAITIKRMKLKLVPSKELGWTLVFHCVKWTFRMSTKLFLKEFSSVIIKIPQNFEKVPPLISSKFLVSDELDWVW